MRGPTRSLLLAGLAACAFGALTAGSASAATMEAGTSPLLAIYGYPGASVKSPAVEQAIGGGLGRNFGFGENMLFQAGVLAGTEALEIEITGGSKSKADESFIGGTLMSNKTGANNPLSFTIQFVDFQDNFLGTTATPSYADTSDRPWITEICPLTSTTCKVDPKITAPAAGEVKIEDVSFNIGPTTAAGGGTVVQGTAWGTWADGNATGKPPCITLRKPTIAAVANETLYVTQPFASIGAKAIEVKGKACLISANNDWYKLPGEEKTPEIKIANT